MRRRLRRGRRTMRFFSTGQSCVHSAHIGQECVVHYRWHAHFGQRLRVEGIEHRAGGSVASVEVQPGLIVKIAAWMLDPAACASMEIGAPRASLAALSALHDLLVARGLRRTFSGDRIVIEEKADEDTAAIAEPAERTLPTDHTTGHPEVAGNEPEGTERRPWRTGQVDAEGDYSRALASAPARSRQQAESACWYSPFRRRRRPRTSGRCRPGG